MRQTTSDKEYEWLQIGYWLAFVTICACFFFRCRFSLGAAFSDEFSQPATVNRYLHGDVPIIDNWTASTMFSGFVMSLVCRLLGIGMVPILMARYLYVVYQAVIAAAIYFLMPKKNVALMASSLVYLCSTPYNINRITYNTLSIGLFILFCILFFGATETNNGAEYSSNAGLFWKTRILLSGVVLALVVLAIPHNAMVFFVYTAAVIVVALIRRGKHNQRKCLIVLSTEHLFFMTIGIMLVAVPFVVYFLLNGSASEYMANLGFILSDAEYSKSCWVKLFESQLRIIRIYWRIWLPLVIMDCVVAVLFRDKKEFYWIIYSLSNLVILYGVVRFSFIYGSVSINLAVPAFFFLGVQVVVMELLFKNITLKRDIYNSVLISWLVFGYAFYICEYLATDTEILSSSAALIVVAIPAILLDYELLKLMGKNKLSQIVLPMTVCGSLICLFILRMTYVWGDAPISQLNYKIDSGAAKGIITTRESAERFLECESVIENAELRYDDQVLILPMNPTYYYLADAGCASPYIFRFEVSVDELNNYYTLHPEKMPSVVVACKNDDSGNEYDLNECLGYFENMTDMGYYVYYNSDDAIVLKR